MIKIINCVVLHSIALLMRMWHTILNILNVTIINGAVPNVSLNPEWRIGATALKVINGLFIYMVIIIIININSICVFKCTHKWHGGCVGRIGLEKNTITTGVQNYCCIEFFGNMHVRCMSPEQDWHNSKFINFYLRLPSNTENLAS